MTSPEVVVVTLLRTLRAVIVCSCGSELRVAGEPEDVARAHARTFFFAHADCGVGGTPARQPFGADPQQAASPATQAVTWHSEHEREIAAAYRRAGLAGATS